MKKILAILIALVLLTTPVAAVFAFYCPPEDPPVTPEPEEPCWYLTINGLNPKSNHLVNFTEPDDGKCTTFTVEVNIINVEDLYGYEFTLWWYGFLNNYINLTGYEYEFYADDMWDAWFKVMPDPPNFVGATHYSQAISAKNSDSFEGDATVAVLTFHIYEDICWCQTEFTGWFYLEGEKMYDSCGELIPVQCEIDVAFRYIATQPHIFLEPDLVTNCKLPGEFSIFVMVENVTTMKSLHLVIPWTKYHLDPDFGCYDMYTSQMNITDVIPNADVFPEADRLSFTWSYIGYWPYHEGVEIDIVMNYTNCQLIRGSFMAFELVFEKKDPWCPEPGFNGQPNYIDTDCGWETENCTSDIFIWWGYFDGECRDECHEPIEYYEIWFGTFLAELGTAWPVFPIDPTDPPHDDYFDNPHDDYCGSKYYVLASIDGYPGAQYILDPLVGDLDGDGDVNLDDLMIIASYYHLWGCEEAFYDLNNDHVVDIGDVVIVGKEYGNECQE